MFAVSTSLNDQGTGEVVVMMVMMMMMLMMTVVMMLIMLMMMLMVRANLPTPALPSQRSGSDQ